MTGALATLPEPGILVVRRAGSTVTLRPAPRREPPFDDELDDSVRTGPFDRPLPFDEWRPTRRPLKRVPLAPRRSLPDPEAWGRRLLIGIVETAGGKRPLHQLAALFSPSVAHGVGIDFERAARQDRRHWLAGAAVRSIRATEPTDDVAELAATMRVGERVRAVAIRLEVRRGRWCCTRLVLG